MTTRPRTPDLRPLERDVQRAVTLDLPEPPSVNNMYATVGRRRVLTAAGRAYKASVAAHCILAKIRPITGPVRLTIIWRRARRSGDLDNRAKACLDALKTFAFHDDSQVTELHLFRQDDKVHCGATVTVEAA